MKLSNIIISIAFSSFVAFTANAQKIQIGSYSYKDGSVYSGEISAGKPNGKGRTQYRNGDV